jgi:predicted amidophosphoribosyltransferase
MGTPDDLAQVRATFWNPGRARFLNCATCTAPVDGYAVCFNCRSQGQAGSALADMVVPISYAIKGSQAMSDLYQYKDPEAAPDNRARAQNRVFSAFYASLSRHLACIAALSRCEISVATVPSSGGRTGDHPLNQVRTMFGGWDHVEAAYVGPGNLSRDDRRKLDSSRFEVRGDVIGRHVLLIDDTWVSGVHVQSCASALKAAGAGYVTAVTFGRYLDPSYSVTKSYLDDHRARRFDPEICPVSGTIH